MGFATSIEIQGLGELQATLNRFPGELGSARRDGLKVAGQQMVKFWKLQLSGPAGPRRLGVGTGALRNSIRATRRGDGVAVGSDKRYAAIHEFGGKTKPHPISPRVAKVLKFRAGGREVFAKKVQHPGSRIPRRPHRAPAVQSVWPVLQDLFEGKLDEAMRKSLEIGNRLASSQKSDFAKLVAAGGTGRRTR